MLPYILAYTTGLCVYLGLRLRSRPFIFCISMASGATVAAARLVA